MRCILPVLAILLVAPTVPASPPGPGSKHLIQILRSGNGQPRVRDVSAARIAAPRTLDQPDGTRRSRPYQVAQPGEGEPKG